MPSNFSENVKQTNVIASKFNDPPGNTRQTVNHTFCSCFSLLVWITLVFARRLSISLNNITDPDRLSPLKQRLRFCVRQLHFRSRIQLFSSLLILYSRFFISPFLFFKRKNKIKFVRWKRERKIQKLPKKKKEFALSRYNIFITRSWSTKESKIVLKSGNKYWYLLKNWCFSLFPSENKFIYAVDHNFSFLVIDMPISFCFSQENYPMDFFSKEKESETDLILMEYELSEETWSALDLNIPFF